MTVHRIRQQAAEQRMLAGLNPNGYQLMDPSAIPPHGYEHLSRAGVMVTPHSMLMVDVVYTALRIISNNIIKMGNLRAYTEGWDPRIGAGYREFQQNQPAILTNTFGGGNLGGLAGMMMQCTGRDRTIWSMGLFGEAFWWILTRDKRKAPQTIEVLHPAFMEVKAQNGKVQYFYGSGKDKVELDPLNLIHIPGKSLPAARRAMAPTDYAQVAAALAIAAYEFGSSWFSQGAAPSFILSTEQKLGQDEVNRIAAKFQVEHAGLANSHKALVLDSGVKASRVMSSPDEAQYLQTLEYARQVLGQWFGIPASKMPNALQKPDLPAPHSRQEDQLTFEIDTLSQFTVPLEEVHSALIPDDGVSACFDEHALSRADAQFLAMEVQALRTTQVAAINDLRVRKYGWKPFDDEAAYDPIQPLASNVSPDQTENQNQSGNQGMFPKGQPGGQDERMAWLEHRLAVLEAERNQ